MSSLLRHRAAVFVAGALLAASPAIAQTSQSHPGHATAATQPAPQRAHDTTVEFTTVTRLPGVTLQPGKYVFRPGAPVGRHSIVEVYSADGRTKIATLLTMDYAVPPGANRTTVLFENVAPSTLRAWYIPGQATGREFVYTENEARTLHASAKAPVLWAAWNPDDRTGIGHVEVQTVGQAIGQAARKVADVAKDVARNVAGVATDVWDDIADNATLVNPTESRIAAERHLDAAEKAYDDLEDRVSGDVETRLQPLGSTLEMLEDAFEKGQSWMGHYTAVMASLDALSPDPDKPVGTSGRGVTIDASTNAALLSIRGHLRAFHAQAIK